MLPPEVRGHVSFMTVIFKVLKRSLQIFAGNSVSLSGVSVDILGQKLY